MFRTCSAGDRWDFLGGFSGSAHLPDRGLRIDGSITNIAVDYSSPASARRVLVSAGMPGPKAAVWMYDPAGSPSWTSLFSASGVLERAAQGPHTYPHLPRVALMALSNEVVVIDLHERKSKTIALRGPALLPAAQITAVATLDIAAQPAGDAAVKVLIGGRSLRGPGVFSASFSSTDATANATAVAEFVDMVDPSLAAGVSRMAVTALVVKPGSEGPTVVAGLGVGDFYDGDIPPGLFVSNNGGRLWKRLEAQLPNQVVASMAFAPDGRLCVSSIGDGLLCLEV